MLSCNEVRQRLSDAIDGEVPWWTRAQMRLHLAMCDECSRIERSLRRTVSLLHELQGEAPIDVETKDGGS